MDTQSITQQNIEQEVLEMPGKIINHIPRLLKERNLEATDLMYGARIAPGTAYALAKGKEQSYITYDILARICSFLNVEVEDVLEYVPEE